jgi:hypothetical protein
MMGAAKPRKSKPPLAERIARNIVPIEQVRRKDYTLADVANHTDAEQRHMVRSGEKKTIKRKTNIQVMVERGVLTREQGRLCEWYAEQHELGFATVGCTANYLGAGGGGFGAMDLLARYAEQANARGNYAFAKAALGPLAPLFEKVVLTRYGLPWGKRHRTSLLHRTFDLAVRRLDEAVGHLVA